VRASPSGGESIGWSVSVTKSDASSPGRVAPVTFRVLSRSRMTSDELPALPAPARRIYCNRTLNLRAIGAVGFDMDYTLVHYRTEAWERRAYEYAQRPLIERGWPVAELDFDPSLVALGLILDLECGNLVKANRFGYVKRAYHGTKSLEYQEQRKVYGRTQIDLALPRWVFMNTLFALSEACLYSQCVDLLDAGKLPEVMGYEALYRIVRSGVDEAHMLGELKAEIVAHPEQYIEPDPEVPLALMDLRHAGKKVLLITNSEWEYTRDIMRHAVDPFMPEGQTWRDLFDLVIVGSRKPAFFTDRSPVFEVVDEEGLLRPHLGALEEGQAYLGGHAGLVEDSLGISGQEILYVGDHIFSDINISKRMLSWRTGLVVRDLEAELSALEDFKPMQAELSQLMIDKEHLEHAFSVARLALMRLEQGYGAQTTESPKTLTARMQALRTKLVALDAKVAPLAQRASALAHPRWGLSMRAGNDKSHLARQIERNADIYTSRVGNFLHNTPFVYLRSPRGSLPHDSGLTGGAPESDTPSS